MTARDVIEAIAPGIVTIEARGAVYDGETRVIAIPDLGAKDLVALLEAAHEAFHALRHRQGHPFYSDEGWGNWNEEAIEEVRVIALSESWLAARYPDHCEEIRVAANETRKEAIKADPGFVSKWGE